MGTRLSDSEFTALLAVLRLGDRAYGIPIAQELEAVGRRTVAVAAVYATMNRLEARGLVSSSLGEATPERGGRPKRFFRVTAKGLRAARDTRRALVDLWTGLPQLEGTRG